MKSWGLAGVHASVTCLFSHLEGEAREHSGLPIRERAEEGRVTQRLHYDISDGVVKNRAELSVLMHRRC